MKLSIQILSLTLLFFFPGCNSDEDKTIPKARLVGEFLFSGNANDTNPTGITHDGTIHGAVLSTDRKGRSDRAFSFDGVDDYISIADNDSLEFDAGDDYAISVWVSVAYPQETPANTIFDIIRKWTGNAEGYPYSISFLNEEASVPNTFIFAKYDGSTCANVPTLYSSSINNDNWAHIVVTKNSSFIYCYLNGVKVAEINDVTDCTTTNTSDITIGCRGQLVRFFKGKIDDIRFYSKALTEKEISQLFKE